MEEKKVKPQSRSEAYKDSPEPSCLSVYGYYPGMFGIVPPSHKPKKDYSKKDSATPSQFPCQII